MLDNYGGQPESSRLELLYEKSGWVVSLRISPTKWYNKVPCSSRVKPARQWIQETKENHSLEIDDNPDEQCVSVTVPEYCSHTFACDFATRVKSGGCFKEHTPLTCPWMCTKRDGQLKPCGWFCFEELRLPLTDQYFTFMVRGDWPGFPRDLLLLPTPAPHKYHGGEMILEHSQSHWPSDVWKGHYSNSELAVMPFFWQNVADRVQQLAELTRDAFPLECIALNFGEWKTAISKGPYAIECHGHAHFALKKSAQQTLAHKPDWKPSLGRYHPSQHYALKDAYELEARCVLGDGIVDLASKVEELKKEMTRGFEGLVNKLDKLLAKGAE